MKSSLEFKQNRDVPLVNVFKFFFTTVLHLLTGAFQNVALTALIVGGGDTAHGSPPGLVSPPTRDILKCTPTDFNKKRRKKRLQFILIIILNRTSFRFNI
jgi:hypothetical protein